MSRSTILSCALCLTLGLLVGREGQLRLTSSVQAKALDGSTAERLYGELRNGPLQQYSETLAKIARLATHSVVHIQSEHKTRGRGMVEETGSGVVVQHPRGSGMVVVTNRHVVEGVSDISQVSIHLHDGRVIHPTEVLSDKQTDIAVLRIPQNDVQPARWGDSERVEIGHMVIAVGSPFGLSQSVTSGIISAKGRRSLKLGDTPNAVLNQDFMQTDAAINPGNSGGPLLNAQGEVIGINTAIASNSGGNEGIGFSIPSNMVQTIVYQLLDKGKVTRAYIGVKLNSRFDTETAQRLHLDRLRGAHVLMVYEDSPAFRAKLAADDVVLTFDDIEVQDENHLINLVSLTALDKKVKLIVLRDGRRVPVEITLTQRPDDQASNYRREPGMGTKVESLGLTLHQMDADLAAQLGLEQEDQGLLVLSVERHGPLSKDLQVYDLIEEVGRTPVKNLKDLQTALAKSEGRDSVLLKVRRNRNGVSVSEVVVIHP